MALHSAYPDPDGLALAERWGDGKPGEIAGKGASSDVAGGITYRLILREAKARGWRPEAARSVPRNTPFVYLVLSQGMVKTTSAPLLPGTPQSSPRERRDC